VRVIFNDLLQTSDAPAALKTPALADTSTANGLTVTFPASAKYNAIGIGNTSAPEIIVNGQTITLEQPDTNGLYMLPQEYEQNTVTLSISSEYTVGRIAVGFAHSVGLSPAREPGFWSTNNSRTTLSGQVIAGVGGVTGRKITVDVRYKLTREMVADIEAAYPSQIGRDFPLFVDFLDCSDSSRYPWPRLYAATDKNIVLQSSVRRFLYSKKWTFEERY